MQPARRVLVGRDPARTAEAAERFGWDQASTDWRAVLEREDIHAVDICTPGNSHAEIAIAALEAGKHVLLEKPLANCIGDARLMVAAAEDARSRGVRSMVSFNYRRIPALAYARQLISEGRIGHVRQVRMSFLQDWLVDASAGMRWRLRKAEAGSGVIGDLGSHLVDLCHALLSEPIVEVSGLLHTFVPERPGPSGMEQVDVDDAFWATARTASGTIIAFDASRVATGHKASLVVELYGAQGAIRFDLQRMNELEILDDLADPSDRGFRTVNVTQDVHPYLDGWWPRGHVLGWDVSFVNQLADFLECVRVGTDPEPSFSDGLRAELVLSAVSQSAASGGGAVDVPLA
jgi:predicted dehydrogenase